MQSLLLRQDIIQRVVNYCVKKGSSDGSGLWTQTPDGALRGLSGRVFPCCEQAGGVASQGSCRTLCKLFISCLQEGLIRKIFLNICPLTKVTACRWFMDGKRRDLIEKDQFIEK